MTWLDWNSGNVYFKCTNFCVHIFFANLSQFCKIKYTHNFPLNCIPENKYTLNIHKIHISWNKYTQKKCAQKMLVNSAFLESINSNSFFIMTCLSFCWSWQKQLNIPWLNCLSCILFSLRQKFISNKFSETCHLQK